MVCGCRFPCIPKNGSRVEALGVTQQQEPKEKRQGVGGQQNTRQAETQQVLVRGHEEIRQGAGEQEETWQGQEGNEEQPWQQVGGAGRPKCSICGKTRNTMSAMEKHMKDHEEELYADSDDSSFNCRKCDFQSQAITQLREHLRIKHDLHTCSDCNTTCTSENNLDIHMKEYHTLPKHGDVGQTLNRCDRCGKNFKTDRELMNHIREDHKTYKPCDYFAEDKCELDSDCRYYHIKLKQGEHICFKCAKRTTSKRELMNHIKDTHGNDICHRYLRNECRQKRCFFSHNIHTENTHTRALGTQDFPSLPTIRPVVRSQEMAKTPQEQNLALHSLSYQDQNQIKDVTSQVIEACMKEILPRLLFAVSTALTEKKAN